MEKDLFATLKTKLTLSIVSVLAIFLVLLLLVLNLTLISSNHRRAQATLNFLCNNEGEKKRNNEPPHPDQMDFMPPHFNEPPLEKPEYKIGGDQMPPEFKEHIKPEMNLLSRIMPLRLEGRGLQDFAAVQFDESGKNAVIKTPFVRTNLTEEETLSLAEELYEKGIKTKVNYKLFAAKLEARDYGYLLIMIDRANEIMLERRLAIITSVIFLLSIGVAFAIAGVFSSWAVRPVKLAFKNQKRFIADASHELKTPIAVISANIDVLSQEIPENKWLNFIKTENLRMGKLVQDLLYLAKNDAGKITLEKLPFDLRETVEGAVLPFENLCREQNKKLSVNTGKDVVPVNGDENKIRQLVIILVDNAIKNSSEGDAVTVTAGKSSSSAFVKVHNTGPGISQKDMEKIFDRFYRADTSRARETGGYGLGLAIAKSIASSHNGKISVESKEGEYAEFTLTLPLLSM